MGPLWLSVNVFRSKDPACDRLAATIKRTGKGGLMLWTIVVIILILWLLGALGTVSLPVLSGNTVHILLVIVIVIVAIQLLQRRRL
jgi:uncharacterized protein with PQ loop repeat